MVRWFGVVSFLLIFYLSVTAPGQEDVGPPSSPAIELEGSDGRILVFPRFFTGPTGLIVRFVMFGINQFPEVFIRTVDETVTPEITAVHFSPGDRFSGWFDVPQQEIVTIWIDGWFIPWEDERWQ